MLHPASATAAATWSTSFRAIRPAISPRPTSQARVPNSGGRCGLAEAAAAAVPGDRIAQSFDGRPAAIAELALGFGRGEVHGLARHPDAVRSDQRLPHPSPRGPGTIGTRALPAAP